MYEAATNQITLLLPQILHKYEFGIFITKHSFKIRKKKPVKSEGANKNVVFFLKNTCNKKTFTR